MAWRYNAGLVLIVSVVVMWVTSAEVTQDIFTAYKQPFAITYLGASLMVIYLPISFIKDLLCKSFRKFSSKGDHWNTETDNKASKLHSPTKYKEMQKLLQIEPWKHSVKKYSDVELSGKEEAMPFIAKFEDDFARSKEHREPSKKEIAAYGFCLAPIWFVTEYLANTALAQTSVASSTVLSSTSGLFTLFFAAYMGQDSLNVTKLAAVLVSMVGVVMTTQGKTWAADDPQLNSSEAGKWSLMGDVCSLLSAVFYGVFTVLLKKFSGDEGGRIDVQKLFGYVGLFTLAALWWLVYPLTALGIEPEFTMPTTARMDEIVLANGLIGILSDYCWALSVVWTTPLVATLGMSLTIPLAMVADMMIHDRHYSVMYILGSVQVFVGFVIVNLSNRLSKASIIAK